MKNKIPAVLIIILLLGGGQNLFAEPHTRHRLALDRFDPLGRKADRRSALTDSNLDPYAVRFLRDNHPLEALTVVELDDVRLEWARQDEDKQGK